MQLGNGMSGGSGFENWVSISLVYKTKNEKRELRKKLEGELGLVRNLARKLERYDSGSRSFGNNGNCNGNGNGNVGKLKRVHSGVGSVGWPEGKPTDHLSVVIPENSQGGSQNVEKEKRASKSNQFYQSSDFILGKDKIPLSEHSKKSKGMGKKNGESGMGTGMVMNNTSSKVFKNCSLLLDKLMKHKHGWVFNTPVDVKALDLHDYFTIIKHPMDLGTVKSRLNTNWYKSPKEFAEDVRLTFNNAMKYNPKGHDVHIMAEILSKMFEEKWRGIEFEYERDQKIFIMNHETSVLTPTSRKTPIDMTKPLDISESKTNPGTMNPKNLNPIPSGRTPVPRKPKAKDLNKRGMTYVEKKKLSNELQNLPSEKLDNVVQIIKKRNPTLCQNDDEIEIDIDNVDIETLWELDRFVMYFKKNLKKIQKISETQVKDDTDPTVEKNEEEPREMKAGKEEKNDTSLLSAQHEKKAGKASRSNSPRSSSSGSGSSSSGSDSDSSST